MLALLVHKVQLDLPAHKVFKAIPAQPDRKAYKVSKAFKVILDLPDRKVYKAT